MNVPREKLDVVIGILPSLHTPTISGLSDSEWVAIEVIIDEQVVRDIIPSLRRAGAQGIVEYPLNKVILRGIHGEGIRCTEEDAGDPNTGTAGSWTAEGAYHISTGFPFSTICWSFSRATVLRSSV